MQGDDVRAAVQFVQRGVYHLVLAGEIVVGIQVVEMCIRDRIYIVCIKTKLVINFLLFIRPFLM